MLIKFLLTTAVLAVPGAALAQSAMGPWHGAYVGGRIGYGWVTGGNGESIRFDRDLDGVGRDTVTTAAGANAFSPGFCGGYAQGPTPADGCDKDDKGIDFAVHAGFDFQDAESPLVYGIVVEVGSSGAKDAVSAFSTTPAFYTMERKVKYDATIRARTGYAFGNSLVYGTAGITAAKIRNRFTTSNTANAFTDNGGMTSYGYKVGGGVEHKLTDNLSIGALYLYSNLDAKQYRVRAGNSGTTPAANPFILANPGGTDFRRSYDRFDSHSVSLTASLRF